MAITLHLIGLLAVLLLTTISVVVFGHKPTGKNIGVGLIIATLVACVFLCCTVVLYREGDSARLLVSLWLCIGAVATLIPSPRKVAVGCVLLFAYFFGLRFQYLSLATSAHYTDNPQWRTRNITRRNKMALGQGKPPGQEVVIRSTFHTWLTGLYAVEPPAGGSP